jgi:hypothetical protein
MRSLFLSLNALMPEPKPERKPWQPTEEYYRITSEVARRQFIVDRAMGEQGVEITVVAEREGGE